MRRFVFAVAVCTLIALPLAAQNTDIESLSGLQFNFGNPGARSLGMGGAFLGLADDASAAEAKVTQLLFVGSAQEAQFAALEHALHSLPVLTVGESPGFATLGGAIDFVPQGDKIRFEINIDAAEHAGLKISAQLQKLATVVHRSPT